MEPTGGERCDNVYRLFSHILPKMEKNSITNPTNNYTITNQKV